MSDQEPSGYRENLKAARASGAISFADEKRWHVKNKKLWDVYERNARKYSQDIKKVLPEGFKKFNEKSEEKLLYLDAFAPSTFLRDMAKTRKGIKGGMALSLADLRSIKQKEQDEKLNITQVENANIYDRREWLYRMDDFLKLNGKTGFDVITCLPEGGWMIQGEAGMQLYPTNDMVWLVTNFLWNHLAVNGEMFINFSYLNRESFNGWIKKMKDAGMVTASDGNQVRFKKISEHLTIPAFPPINFTPVK